MRDKVGVQTVEGPQNWSDTYSVAGNVRFRIPKNTPVPYERLEWDYSETRPEWRLRHLYPSMYIPPTNVHTFDRRPMGRRAYLSLSYPATAEERVYEGVSFFPPQDAIKFHGIESFDWTNSLIKAQSDLKGSKANLGEAFIEAGQTADMILNSIYRLSQLAKDLIAIKKRTLGYVIGKSDDVVVDISQLWLQYKYGWRPLVDDAYAAYQLLREKDKTRPYLITGKGKTTSTKTQTGTFIDLYDYWGTTASLGWEGTAKKTSRTKLTFAVPFDYQDWQRKTMVDNPAAVTWEILPYSFVADWFLPMGTYLDAIGYADGLLFKGGFTSVVSEVEVRYTTSESNSSRGVAHANASKDPCVTSKYHRRVAHDSAPPVPFPNIDRSGLRGSRIASAAALLLQHLGGRDLPIIKY